jgi:predicted RNA-binding protein with RPS1 domain
MMIDENQTPMGGEQAQTATTVAEPASVTTPVALPPNDDTTHASPIAADVNAELPVSAQHPDEAVASESELAELTPVADTTEEGNVAEAVQPGDPQPSTPTTPVEPPAPQPEIPQPREPETPTQPVEPIRPQPKGASSDADLFEAAMRELEGGGQDNKAANEGSFKKLSRGDRVEATIIQVDRDRVFVDLGTKSEGIVPLGELSDDNLESAKDHFNVGDKINVVVLRPEGAEGNPIVSKKRAEFEAAWDRIEEAFKSEQMITAQVVDRVKGGLVVDVGVRGFVPATHVGSGKLRNIEKYVGQPLQLKVIEIDRERKKVVLSNRQAEEERRAAAKENIFQDVKPGDVLDGTVRRLTDYGAFIDLGGVDGLLHISEMSWMRINHPKEMFKEGQKIKVMVLRLDPAAGKISLGHRQVLPDPWNLIKQNYTVGQKLNVTIGRIVQSGAFVKLPEGAEAFMPVSEMSFRRIKRPQDAIEENQEVEAQIIDLRPDERRMVLSMRATGNLREERGSGGGGYEAPSYGGDDDRGDKRGKPGGKKTAKKGRGGRDYEDDFEEVAGRRGFATGGATIGERLGALKGIFSRDDDEDEEATAEAGDAVEGGDTAAPEAVATAPEPAAAEEAPAEPAAAEPEAPAQESEAEAPQTPGEEPEA